MKTFTTGRIAPLSLLASLALGCASAKPTSELTAARQAYERARTGIAGEQAPAEVYEAKRALRAAEREHKEEPGSTREADLAYIAHRKALEAMALGQAHASRERIASARIERETVLVTQRDEASEEIEKMRQAFAGGQRRLLVLPSDVLFETNKAALMQVARTRLDKVASALGSEPDGSRIIVQGHADATGTSEHNDYLSKARAEAVKQHLVHQGFPADRIVTEGMGENHPIASNDTVEGRASNRRVEILIQEGAAPAKKKP